MRATDVLLGTSELDPSTLDYQYRRPGRRALHAIEAMPGGLYFTLDAHDVDGTGHARDVRRPARRSEQHLPAWGVTLVLNLLEDGSVESLALKGGVVDRWTRAVSADGQAMTITQHGVTPAGTPFRNTGIDRRMA